jgi:hypothetical protein
MAKILMIISILTLYGCATPPIWLAAYYDSQDPCQRPLAEMPNWCGSGTTTVKTYDTNRKLTGYIEK